MFRNRKKRPDVIQTARGQRVFAIGDIHGRYDLLEQILDKVLSRFQSPHHFGKFNRLIFLGDIIDRGPDSHMCLRAVQHLVSKYGAELVIGNHEDLLLHTMKGDQEACRIWLERAGGLATLKSFDISPPLPHEDGIDFGERLKQAIPEKYTKMLEDAPTTLRSGDYLFVHAGVKPGVPLANQENFDLFFIRDEFTQSQDWHGAMVVHGHTIVEKVEQHPNRIAIDTGAYRSGRLSCLVLNGQKREILITQ